ncbi:hypothetical protein JYU34_016576 [Plutella xylostella]|uniref:Uncharacterized protein n=1 Tax=Plutella xylostella TaxID=51655 RepID=A0ABQ7Q2Y1_PLUXY|nr:hypothetical protein JYU34_016576 [Plutella xylostella]
MVMCKSDARRRDPHALNSEKLAENLRAGFSEEVRERRGVALRAAADAASSAPVTRAPITTRYHDRFQIQKS